MKRVIYFSLSANPWQRSALLDSALSASQDSESEIIFTQAYTPETSFMDLPLSSSADYLVAKIQDLRLSRMFKNSNFKLRNYSTYGNHKIIRLSEEDLKMGYEETITKTRDSKPCRIHAQNLISHYAKLHHLAYRESLSYLQEMQPDLVFIFNGRFYREKAIWRAARELGIQVHFIERFAPTWGNRYFEFQGPVHDIGYRCSLMKDFWTSFTEANGEEAARKIADKWFIDRSIGINQSFTADQTLDFRFEFGDKKVITFFHSSEDELFTTELGSALWDDQIIFLQALQEAFSKLNDFHLVVRVHPNLRHKSQREITRWRKFESDSRHFGSTFIMHDSPIKSYDLLNKSDYILTFGSTIGVEASFFGKPSVLVSRAFHENLEVVQSINDIRDLIETLTNGIPKTNLQRFQKNTGIYGLFHAAAGIRFRNLTSSDMPIQDPVFTYGGVNIKSFRIISLLRRLEGKIIRSLPIKFSLLCKCG